MINLSDIKGVGPSRLEHLRAMGISSLRDLLYFLPIRYEDQQTVTPIRDAWNSPAMVRGTVREKPKIAYFHGMSRVTARIEDETGTMPLCWFNEPWMIQQLPVGQEIMLHGRIQVRERARQMLNPKVVTEPGWMPVYRPVPGIPAKSLRGMIGEALSAVAEICPETLPKSFRNRYRLTERQEALRQAHQPENQDKLRDALRRLNFEQVLMYMAGVALQRGNAQPGYAMEIPPEASEEFWDHMPFRPTEAQRRVLREIAADMTRERAMSRLVQGDVGCGKTALAFGSVYLAAKSGYQSAMMAPTEILARQHYQNAAAQLEPLGISCRLLTGSTKAKERREILKALEDGSCQAVFGTHALISEGVNYRRLGLVITDEQHRFGVRQRSRLQEKGMARLTGTEGKEKNAGGEQPPAPHVLVMSATPIPRTLALILYGDLDLSVVDELPPGRQAVKTRLVPEQKRADMYRFLRQRIAQGQQAYIVCPLVEDSEAMDEVRSAKAMYDEMTGKELSGLKVGLTWGQQKSEEKAETLRAFAAGETDVLIATTVIEVGVNVPNATVMIIENAERFGLSQLHQLRGRVGRGKTESWCFLLSGSGDKLRILCETNDGFEVARKDLEMRGPGDLTGTRQSGEALSDALLGGGTLMLDEAARAVRELESDPSLEREWRQIRSLAGAYFREKNLKVAKN